MASKTDVSNTVSVDSVVSESKTVSKSHQLSEYIGTLKTVEKKPSKGKKFKQVKEDITNRIISSSNLQHQKSSNQEEKERKEEERLRETELITSTTVDINLKSLSDEKSLEEVVQNIQVEETVEIANALKVNSNFKYFSYSIINEAITTFLELFETTSFDNVCELEQFKSFVSVYHEFATPEFDSLVHTNEYHLKVFKIKGLIETLIYTWCRTPQCPQQVKNQTEQLRKLSHLYRSSVLMDSKGLMVKPSDKFRIIYNDQSMRLSLLSLLDTVEMMDWDVSYVDSIFPEFVPYTFTREFDKIRDLQKKISSILEVEGPMSWILTNQLNVILEKEITYTNILAFIVSEIAKLRDAPDLQLYDSDLKARLSEWVELFINKLSLSLDKLIFDVSEILSKNTSKTEEMVNITSTLNFDFKRTTLSEIDIELKDQIQSLQTLVAKESNSSAKNVIMDYLQSLSSQRQRTVLDLDQIADLVEHNLNIQATVSSNQPTEQATFIFYVHMAILRCLSTMCVSMPITSMSLTSGTYISYIPSHEKFGLELIERRPVNCAYAVTKKEADSLGQIYSRVVTHFPTSNPMLSNHYVGVIFSDSFLNDKWRYLNDWRIPYSCEVLMRHDKFSNVLVFDVHALSEKASVINSFPKQELVNNLLREIYRNPDAKPENSDSLGLYLYLNFRQCVFNGKLYVCRCPECDSLSLSRNFKCGKKGCVNYSSRKEVYLLSKNEVIEKQLFHDSNIILAGASDVSSKPKTVSFNLPDWEKIEEEYVVNTLIQNTDISKFEKSGSYKAYSNGVFILKSNGLGGALTNVIGVILAYRNISKDKKRYIIYSCDQEDMQSICLELFDESVNRYDSFGENINTRRCLPFQRNCDVGLATLAAMIQKNDDYHELLISILTMDLRLILQPVGEHGISGLSSYILKDGNFVMAYKRLQLLNMFYISMHQGALPSNEMDDLTHQYLLFQSVISTTQSQNLKGALIKFFRDSNFDDVTTSQLTNLLLTSNVSSDIGRLIKIPNSLELSYGIRDNGNVYHCSLCNDSFYDVFGHVLTNVHIEKVNIISFNLMNNKSQFMIKTHIQRQLSQGIEVSEDEKKRLMSEYYEAKKREIGFSCVCCATLLVNGSCPNATDHPYIFSKYTGSRIPHYDREEQYVNSFSSKLQNNTVRSLIDPMSSVQKVATSSSLNPTSQNSNKIAYSKILANSQDDVKSVKSMPAQTKVIDEDARSSTSYFSTKSSKVHKVKLTLTDFIIRDGKAIYNNSEFDKCVHGLTTKLRTYSQKVSETDSPKNVLYKTIGLTSDSDNSVYLYFTKELENFSKNTIPKINRTFSKSQMMKGPLFNFQITSNGVRITSKVNFFEKLTSSTIASFWDARIKDHLIPEWRKTSEDQSFDRVDDFKSYLYYQIVNDKAASAPLFDCLLLFRLRYAFNRGSANGMKQFEQFYGL